MNKDNEWFFLVFYKVIIIFNIPCVQTLNKVREKKFWWNSLTGEIIKYIKKHADILYFNDYYRESVNFYKLKVFM